MRLRVVSCIGLVAAVAHAAATMAADGDAGYRLAGIVSTGSERVGFLQVPQGGQVVVRQGSVINGGTVVEFSDRRLRIAFQDHTLELTLDGAPGARLAGALAAAAPSDSSTAPRQPQAQAPAARAAKRRPPPPLMPTPVARSLSAAATMQFRVNGLPEAPANADPGRYVADQLASSFDLPEHSRLLSVNEQPITSAAQAVDDLQQALERGVAVLNLDTPTGPQRVYLMPQRRPGG